MTLGVLGVLLGLRPARTVLTLAGDALLDADALAHVVTVDVVGRDVEGTPIASAERELGVDVRRRCEVWLELAIDAALEPRLHVLEVYVDHYLRTRTLVSEWARDGGARFPEDHQIAVRASFHDDPWPAGGLQVIGELRNKSADVIVSAELSIVGEDDRAGVVDDDEAEIVMLASGQARPFVLRLGGDEIAAAELEASWVVRRRELAWRGLLG